MIQAIDPQLESLVARALEPRLAGLPPQAVVGATREVFLQLAQELQGDQERVRLISEALVMHVARRWGNIVQAGKASVLASRDSAEHLGLTPARAAEQAALGAASGVRLVGPVAFAQLRNELQSLVQNFDELTAFKAPPRSIEWDSWEFDLAEPDLDELAQSLRPTALPEPGPLVGWEPALPAPEQKRLASRWWWIALSSLLALGSGWLILL